MAQASTERTIFQKIWDGDISAYPLFKSEEHGVMAFLDAFPATPGHTLVIPEEPVDELLNLEDGRRRKVREAGDFIAQHLRKVLQPERTLEFVVGYGVPHAHVQIVPSYERADTGNLWKPERMAVPAPDAELATMQERLVLSGEQTNELEDRLGRIALAHAEILQ